MRIKRVFPGQRGEKAPFFKKQNVRFLTRASPAHPEKRGKRRVSGARRVRGNMMQAGVGGAGGGSGRVVVRGRCL